jgi:hypothetical protein
VKISRNHDAGDISVAAIVAVLAGDAFYHAPHKRSESRIALLFVLEKTPPGSCPSEVQLQVGCTLVNVAGTDVNVVETYKEVKAQFKDS